MGGDHAPREIVLGVLEAIERDPGLEVFLVGREDAMREHLPGGAAPARIHLVHAPEVVEMDDSPVEALRKKPDNSIARALVLVREKKAEAFLSAGNTGACVAAATMILPRLPNARRGGIAVPFPTRTGRCVVMDAGANIQCKPIHLVQYAAMASEYSKDVVGVANPRVGVLSVGGEEGKGNPLVQTVYNALRASKTINFIGNVEGQGIFSGDADVVVCEGFTGNVILKAAEGLSEAFFHMLQEGFRSVTAAGAQDGAHGTHTFAALHAALGEMKKRIDYEAFGGAPLLGHEGAVFISHGRSKSRAMKNAVLAAGSYVDHHVNARITEALAALSAEADVAAALGRDA
jgi:glycerol-3-phosphate acyltransferase PlsX